MSTHLLNIPQEVIDNIFQYLCVSELENIKESITINSDSKLMLPKSNNIRLSIAERYSPYKYLGEMFKDPHILLYNMGILNVFISGFKVLEYFIGDNVANDSEWDFYCDNHRYTIFNIMRTLENSGVVWNTAEDESLISDESSFNEQVRNTNNIGTSFRLVKGIITNKDITQKVRLIYSEYDLGPLDIISQFTSSITQCFMGFGGVAHMYYNTAIKKQSYQWTKHGKLSQQMFNEYTSKNIKFIDPVTNKEIINSNESTWILNDSVLLSFPNKCMDHVKLRSIADSESKFISFEKYNQASVKYGKYYVLYNENLDLFDRPRVKKQLLYNHIYMSSMNILHTSWHDAQHGIYLASDIVYKVNQINVSSHYGMYFDISLISHEFAVLTLFHISRNINDAMDLAAKSERRTIKFSLSEDRVKDYIKLYFKEHSIIANDWDYEEDKIGLATRYFCPY